MSEASPAAGPGRETVGTAFRKYLKPTMAFMLVLGFASGLPLMMVFSKLSFWLREAGIDRASIGGLYAVSFAYYENCNRYRSVDRKYSKQVWSE